MRLEGKIWDVKRKRLYLHVEHEDSFLFLTIERKHFTLSKLFDYIYFTLEQVEETKEMKKLEKLFQAA